MAQQLVDTFEIPENIAKELSDLLAKQSIRERVLASVIGDPEKYEELEKQLIPVVQKIDALKTKITEEFVPDKYDEHYVWNYNGFEVSGTKVQIYKA